METKAEGLHPTLQEGNISARGTAYSFWKGNRFGKKKRAQKKEKVIASKGEAKMTTKSEPGDQTTRGKKKRTGTGHSRWKQLIQADGTRKTKTVRSG